MRHVFRCCSPFKIFQAVVISNTVLMVYLRPKRIDSKEGNGNNSVN
ncbi:hypothetical protein [Pseudomonas phage HU1]|nr:hypothetical protein [Pseudomonas phage HU1]